MQHLTDLKLENSIKSDTESINSEEESRIENEIKRHNSEDEIDHGILPKSLRIYSQIMEEKDQLLK